MACENIIERNGNAIACPQPLGRDEIVLDVFHPVEDGTACKLFGRHAGLCSQLTKHCNGFGAQRNIEHRTSPNRQKIGAFPEPRKRIGQLTLRNLNIADTRNKLGSGKE